MVSVSRTSLSALSHSIFWRIRLNILAEFISSAWNMTNFHFRLRVSFSIIKLWICAMRFSQFFLDVIPSLNVVERHLRDTAAFIISDNILLNMFLLQVDWMSEKGNIIAIMDKINGVYLIIVSSKIFPPLILSQKSCSTPFFLTPLKFQNLPHLFVVSPIDL